MVERVYNGNNETNEWMGMFHRQSSPSSLFHPVSSLIIIIIINELSLTIESHVKMTRMPSHFNVCQNERMFGLGVSMHAHSNTNVTIPMLIMFMVMVWEFGMSIPMFPSFVNNALKCFTRLE